MKPTEIIRTACAKFTETENRTLARRLFQQHRGLWASENAVDCAIRRMRGKQGRRDRKQNPHNPLRQDFIQNDKAKTELETDYKRDAGTITTRSANITTLAAALAYSKVDLNEWEVDRHVINSWEVTMRLVRDGKEKAETYTNYQVKVWLKKRVPTVAETAAQQFRRLIADLPRARFVRPPPVKGNYLYELGIYDAHLGKLAHDQETGWGDYDCKIAARDYRAATDGLLARTPKGTERIALVFGNDQFNADGETNLTTGGTPQDCDSRYHKVYRLGVEVSIEAIEKALSIAPVHVVIVPGNHDHQTAWHLGECLSHRFHGHRHVSIDNRPTPRKYLHYGQCLIGLTHGNRKHELKTLPNLMAAEMRAVWSQVLFREWHIGHEHTQKLLETVGVLVRTLPALCPPDNWHSGSGYVGNAQGSQAFAWHKTRGLVEIMNHLAAAQNTIKAG